MLPEYCKLFIDHLLENGLSFKYAIRLETGKCRGQGVKGVCLLLKLKHKDLLFHGFLLI
jgi:hypothetical protein